jgi:hypothetical protein
VDWVFDNLQVILVVAGVIAYWVNQRRREKAGEEADYDGDGIPENRPVRKDLDGQDPEADDRARRIQEEIRRKILERRGEGVPDAPPPLPSPTPAPTPDPMRSPPPVAGGSLGDLLRRAIEEVRDPEAESRAAAEQAARERQRQMLEQMRELEVQAQTAREEQIALRAAASARAFPAQRVRSRSALAAELRDPETLRRAILFREVLGPPVGLRK